ncbi:MAG: Gfo/Idh/MocA family oxidoreductase [Phycisphaerales bacterium]|nr:Gfo/Idh/MocA family oxidoreductase [Phycisphaerales bacterium]
MQRIGIIGLGMMGRTHYEAYSKLPNAQVAAICDINPRRAAGDLSGTGGNVLQGGLQQLPMDRIVGLRDYRDLLKRTDIDIVDICVPTPWHAELVVAALAAGKHVVSEKPLARTIEQGEQIAAAVAKAKTFHMPAMCLRFWPQWAWLKEAIAGGRYGAVKSATFRRFATPLSNWYTDGKQSGGAILDLHVHDVDFVNHLFGTPRAVMARGHRDYSGEIDHVSTIYLYDNVPLVTAEGGWCMSENFPFRMQFTVNFQKATADYDLARPDTLVVYQNGKTTPIPCAKEHGYDAELRYFVNCIEQNKRPTVVTAADGVAALKIVDAENRSIASQQIVRL